MVNEYNPDRWVLLEVLDPETDTKYYKVLASWYGGFAGSDSWKLSSAIMEVKKHTTYYECTMFTGSKYFLGKNSTGMSSLARNVFLSMLEKFGNNVKLVELAELDVMVA